MVCWSFHVCEPNTLKKKNAWCKEGVFNFNSLKYYHLESYICLIYEKEKKVELETIGIKAPILFKVVLLT